MQLPSRSNGGTATVLSALLGAATALQGASAAIIPQADVPSATGFSARPIEPLFLRSAPSGDYAPSNITCPAAPTSSGTQRYVGQLRDAQPQNSSRAQFGGQVLNDQERAYVQAHRQRVQADWTSWLSQSIVGLDGGSGGLSGGISNYTSDLSRVPRLGIATSGGGYRAMVSGSVFCVS